LLPIGVKNGRLTFYGTIIFDGFVKSSFVQLSKLIVDYGIFFLRPAGFYAIIL
jgi:hypothetical protein